ncbi:hypothetical protein H257_17523 [Aphanomyces astaci]|uniref:Uncharacterized protein n=1 Tax=Aphanomyces astaci TaxID=112090 RepID=W4FEF2_APHAT|nr:hypothetical protein H257_17523 [Aphanomyces astaci]ETV65882.1 hypothetical protein H257_17523 [Aphanomyces astaci]|eukprot:XP_009844635.1 hypothetical protein H257_17523 [Aphanomyces astaci]
MFQWNRQGQAALAWMSSYVVKKRRSIEKYIDGAADADNKASSDMMSVRLEREYQWRIKQQNRDYHWRIVNSVAK